MAATSRVVSLTIAGPIERADLPALYDRVCRLFARNHGCLVYCDVTHVRADVVTVEALARLQLVARRTQCRVVLRNASAELRELTALMGLTDVLPESAC